MKPVSDLTRTRKMGQPITMRERQKSVFRFPVSPRARGARAFARFGTRETRPDTREDRAKKPSGFAQRRARCARPLSWDSRPASIRWEGDARHGRRDVPRVGSRARAERAARRSARARARGEGRGVRWALSQSTCVPPTCVVVLFDCVFTQNGTSIARFYYSRATEISFRTRRRRR